MLDSQLMQRFVGDRDARAFRDLVERHGPAVLRICRRLTGDLHEAEDALQATFLILARRAPSLRDPGQVDRWLAGVARRVAARARRRVVRRAERERNWAARDVEARSEGEALALAELGHLLREELGRMPEADRRPLTLCYLDGLTHEEAADRIGCPVGTIKARLVRARRRLRDRLDRRGIGLGLGLLLFLLRRPPAASADEAPWAETARLVEWETRGDREAVAAVAPRASDLARQFAGATPSAPRAWVVGTVVLLLATAGVVGLGALRAHADRLQARQVTARLLGVLGVDCRAGP